MKTRCDLLIALILLIGYAYSIIAAHILLAKIDKTTPIPRNVSGEIRLSELKKIVTSFDLTDSAVRATLFLKVANYFIYAFSTLFIYSQFFHHTN